MQFFAYFSSDYIRNSTRKPKSKTFDISDAYRLVTIFGENEIEKNQTKLTSTTHEKSTKMSLNSFVGSSV